jgi:hypothetical protein
MTEFLSPSEHDPTRVRRSKDGRPYVKQRCPASLGPVEQRDDWTEEETRNVWAMWPATCIRGRLPGKTAKVRQCPKCKGKGYVEKLYSRCTSFVSVLDDTTQLQAWKLRITLTGLGVDHALLAELDRTDPDDKDALNSIAERAFEVGDGHVKAQKGTDLHTLTEYVDKGWPLPASLTDYETGQERPVTLQDRADLAAWVRTLDTLEIGHWQGSECFVVQDDYQIGGTYDRRAELLSPICDCRMPVILDLKTGRIDYGAGKIAQQLAVYANSKDYDPATGERTDQDVCTHVGLVVHLPQGTGEASVHVVDLQAGWSAVELSSKVREHRRMSREMIWPLESHAELTH